MKKLSLFFFFLVCFTIYSQDNLSPEFKKFISIDPLDDLLIKTDFEKINYIDFFYFYCLASEDLDKFDVYKKWFVGVENQIDIEVKKEFGRTDITNLDNLTQKKFAENLLIYLHNSIFKKYNVNANTISQMVNNNEFNCVSSSVIYAVFLKRFGLQCNGVETQDHVFIQVQFQNEKIDVETTNAYGFDPGKKKEVLDQFGKTTGFTYVPAIDYKNRNSIKVKKIFLLVYHNLAQLHFNKGNYIKALNLGYIIYKGRDDEKGIRDFNDIFHNYLAVLFNSKKYTLAVENIESYFELFEMNEYLVNLRFDMMYQIVYDWNDYKNYESIRTYLETKNEKYPEIKNAARYADIYFNYYLKIIGYFNSQNNFDKSYVLIKEFNLKYKNTDMEKLFSNTINDQIVYSNKTNNLNLMNDIFPVLKTDFPEYTKTISSNERLFNLQTCYNIFQKGDYQKALIEAKKIKSLYANDNDVTHLLYSCYLQYTIYLYQSKDFDKMVSYCEEALKEFPNDKLLENNFKAFFINSFEESFSKKDYSNARKIINKALEKYPNQSEIINCDIRLKEKNY